MPYRALAIAVAAATAIASATAAALEAAAAAATAAVEHAVCSDGLLGPCCTDFEDVSLLQVGLLTETAATMAPVVSRVSAIPSAEERLSLAKPLLWVHIAKTGTGMMKVLYGHPGICPFAPEEVQTFPMDPTSDLLQQYPLGVYCPGSFNLTYMSRLEIGNGHIGYGPYFKDNKGSAISMFRDPEQRIISSYYWSIAQNSSQLPQLLNSSIREYAEAMQGCQTKMLAVDDYPDGPSPCVELMGSPTPAMVSLALFRLRSGFAFVGLTDEWDLSMCLFHAKFGGACQAHDFMNTRPGPMSSDIGYDTSILQGFTDPSDGQVYGLAKSIFHEDLRRFNVSHETCALWCYSQANL